MTVWFLTLLSVLALVHGNVPNLLVSRQEASNTQVPLNIKDADSETIRSKIQQGTTLMQRQDIKTSELSKPPVSPLDLLTAFQGSLPTNQDQTNFHSQRPSSGFPPVQQQERRDTPFSGISVQQPLDNGRFTQEQQSYDTESVSGIASQQQQQQSYNNRGFSSVPVQQQSYSTRQYAEDAGQRQADTAERMMDQDRNPVYDISTQQHIYKGFPAVQTHSYSTAVLQRSAFENKGRPITLSKGKSGGAVIVTGVENFPVLPAMVYNTGVVPSAHTVTYSPDHAGASVRQHMQTPYTRYVYSHLL